MNNALELPLMNHTELINNSYSIIDIYGNGLLSRNNLVVNK